MIVGLSVGITHEHEFWLNINGGWHVNCNIHWHVQDNALNSFGALQIGVVLHPHWQNTFNCWFPGHFWFSILLHSQLQVSIFLAWFPGHGSDGQLWFIIGVVLIVVGDIVLICDGTIGDGVWHKHVSWFNTCGNIQIGDDIGHWQSHEMELNCFGALQIGVVSHWHSHKILNCWFPGHDELLSWHWHWHVVGSLFCIPPGHGSDNCNDEHVTRGSVGSISWFISWHSHNWSSNCCGGLQVGVVSHWHSHEIGLNNWFPGHVVNWSLLLLHSHWHVDGFLSWIPGHGSNILQLFSISCDWHWHEIGLNSWFELQVGAIWHPHWHNTESNICDPMHVSINGHWHSQDCLFRIWFPGQGSNVLHPLDCNKFLFCFFIRFEFNEMHESIILIHSPINGSHANLIPECYRIVIMYFCYICYQFVFGFL